MHLTPGSLGHPFRALTCEGCGHHHYVPVNCGDRFCPTCGQRRRAQVRSVMRSIVAAVIFRPGFKWRHWIFTIPNREDPRTAVKELLSSFRKLRQRAIWRRSTAGGFGVVEFTRRGNLWHVHLHLVVHAGFVKWSDIRRTWAQVSTGLYCRYSSVPSHRVSSYLTQYLTAEELSADDRRLVSAALKHLRLFLTFGFAFNVASARVKALFACPICHLVHFWTVNLDDVFYSDGSQLVRAGPELSRKIFPKISQQ